MSAPIITELKTSVTEWRGGILNAPNKNDPWFDSKQKADEWANEQSRKPHNNDVWAVWNPDCAAVMIYHEGVRFKSGLT